MRPVPFAVVAGGSQIHAGQSEREDTMRLWGRLDNLIYVLLKLRGKYTGTRVRKHFSQGREGRRDILRTGWLDISVYFPGPGSCLGRIYFNGSQTESEHTAFGGDKGFFASIKLCRCRARFS
jgi:hypothetical protein